MQNWEYKILPLAKVVLKELHETLVELGQDEWELTTSIPGEALPGTSVPSSFLKELSPIILDKSEGRYNVIQP